MRDDCGQFWRWSLNARLLAHAEDVVHRASEEEGEHEDEEEEPLDRVADVLRHRLGALFGASWPILGLSGGPRGRQPVGKPSLTRVSPDLLGTCTGYFSSGDPQGPPRARDVEIL